MTPTLQAVLAEALLGAVRAQRFTRVPDSMQGGAPVGVHPSIDLAVAAFPADGRPLFANVLFSREHPDGLIADIGAEAGPVRNIAFLADQQDGDGRSIAWLPGADWTRMDWKPLFGNGPRRFVAPYPASLLKLMVLVGIARLVDQGRARWEQALSYDGSERPVGDWAFDMTVISCNRSTSALVTLLHATGAIRRADGIETHNELHGLFEALGLPGLRLANTQPDGGWGNAAGAGVGQLQMTAWDTVRLLWLLDPAAPPAPWRPADAPPLLGASRAHVLHCLAEQRLHQILSSSAITELPGWVAGLPARMPGAASGGDVRFAHKTGNTENYSADAGIVQGIAPARRHYLIALTSNLGSRYAPADSSGRCVADWRLPALGAAVDARLREFLGD
ncbi:serine hydrolase [Roseateles violae]|uniref:Serine hydrolase n=1 Tax=Roseateles violae TaxID=3058042 RepID=A0ABT8DM02_9BURK|nr:serine hydrolase [Pelomonas sp. PFR6]MDN3919434.1 serine hydrolase [Pelomonas sp. PFR6]